MLRIEKLDKKVQEEVVRLRTEGFSYNSIAQEIYARFGEDLNEDDVKNYFTKRTDQAVKVMKDSPKLQEKLATQYFATIEQLNTLNGDMWKLFYDLRRDPELTTQSTSCPHCKKKITLKTKSYLTLLKTADHLLKQIQHVDTVLGKLQKKQLNITYNYNDLTGKLTRIMPNLLDKLERQGIIKIKKKISYV